MSGVLDLAVRFAESGRPVFFCDGKRPVTRHGFKDATTDVERLRADYRPEYSVAMPTGALSGLVVLDVDVRDEVDGLASLRHLEREHGALPDTTTVVTPSGGSHFYFRHPGAPVKCSAGRLGSGLDVRGDGGYVVLQNPAGGYVVEHAGPAVPLPAWLRDRVRSPQNGDTRPAPTPAGEWVAMFDGIGEGGRNAALARLIGHLLARRVDVDVAAGLLHAVNGQCCRPPLPSGEVDRIIDSIAGAEAAKRTGGRR